jgi:hypothetical protein
MRFFGFSVPLFVVILAVFVIGAKNPGWLARIPLLNKL